MTVWDCPQRIGHHPGLWRQASAASAGQATVGASGTTTFTLSEEASWTLVLVALKPTTTSGGSCPPPPASSGSVPVVAGSAVSSSVPPASTFTLNLPAGVVAGETLLASVTTEWSNVTVPAGWTLVRTVDGVSKQKVFSKVATGSEPASIPVTLDDTGEQTVGVVLRVQGTAGVDVHVGTSGESTTATGSLTTTVANDLLVGFQGAGLWDSTVASTTPPSGWVEQADVMSAGLWRQASAATAGQATAGASGTKTFTLSEAASWTLVLVALKPTTTSGGGGGGSGSVSGRTETLETLSPSGRVLARTVTDMATNTITENIVFGYASGSDSPAYSKNLMTNVVSTYLGSVNYTGTTGSWPISNAHGDTVGVTDVNATFVANAPTDEYGRGVAPADRLGWLGAHYRFNIGGTQNLTRMGVRLYDPNLGRFLEVDPVEGGNANDYVYPADPVNMYDLDGMRCWTGVSHWVDKKNGKKYHTSGKGRKEVCRGAAATVARAAETVKGGGETVVRGAEAVGRGAVRAARVAPGVAERQLNNTADCLNDVVTIVGGGVDLVVAFPIAYGAGIETYGGSVLAYNAFAVYVVHAMASSARTIKHNCSNL